MKRISALFLAVAAALPFIWAEGVNGAESSLFRQATMTASDFNKNIFPIYKKRQKPGDGMYRIYTQIPSMMVYDPSGNLIFYGKDATEDASFLRNFPQSAKGLGKVDGLFQRDEVFEEVPEFAKAKAAIESDHHYLVFALTRSPFHISCGPQDSAVKEIAEKGAALQVDVLQLAVDIKK